jgi:hypothetical protein
MAITDHPARHDPAPSPADEVERAFRRIAWQRIELAADGTGRGVVVGTGHRRSTSVTVSLDTALELRRRGVRTLVHRER